MKLRTIVLTLVMLMVWTDVFAQQYSAGPRQMGEEILQELVVGKNSVIAKVASRGCTGKKSFRIDVAKQDGVSPIAPHYALTIYRTGTDECKAIVDDGMVLSWDLEKDLALKGPYTFSVRNRVDSGYRPYKTDDEDTFIGIIQRYLHEASHEGGQ